MNPIGSNPGVADARSSERPPLPPSSTDAAVSEVATETFASTGTPTPPPSSFKGAETPPPDTPGALTNNKAKELKPWPGINSDEDVIKFIADRRIGPSCKIVFRDKETQELRIATPGDNKYWVNNSAGTKGGPPIINNVSENTIKFINEGIIRLYSEGSPPKPELSAKLKDEPKNTFCFTRSDNGAINCAIKGENGIIGFSFNLTFFQQYGEVLNSNDQENLLRDAMKREYSRNPTFFDGVDLDNLRLLKESKTPPTLNNATISSDSNPDERSNTTDRGKADTASTTTAAHSDTETQKPDTDTSTTTKT